mmetsp:Transcript_18306/g.45854  ORF Transcript_18306/g.45854 Transcript_18306/m.45854 type:complete len:214 (-) Transcript_18306:328-969(-)
MVCVRLEENLVVLHKGLHNRRHCLDQLQSGGQGSLRISVLLFHTSRKLGYHIQRCSILNSFFDGNLQSFRYENISHGGGHCCLQFRRVAAFFLDVRQNHFDELVHYSCSTSEFGCGRFPTALNKLLSRHRRLQHLVGAKRVQDSERHNCHTDVRPCIFAHFHFVFRLARAHPREHQLSHPLHIWVLLHCLRYSIEKRDGLFHCLLCSIQLGNR